MQFIVAWNFFFLASQIFHRICCKTQVSPKNNQYWFDVKAKRWDRASGGNGSKIFPAIWVSGELKNRSENPTQFAEEFVNLAGTPEKLLSLFYLSVACSLSLLVRHRKQHFHHCTIFYSLNPKCHFICFNVIVEPVKTNETRETGMEKWNCILESRQELYVQVDPSRENIFISR